MEKRLQILMWVVVALLILISFLTIVVGYATNFDFSSGFQHLPELGKAISNHSDIVL